MKKFESYKQPQETDPRVLKQEIVAESFHCDFSAHLTMGVLGNHLLNVAGNHANERHFGIETFKTLSWVLSRLVIEMDEMPAQHEHFTIETWTTSIARLFTNREFAMYNPEGKAIGFATSIWALIDLGTRKPLNPLSVNDGQLKKYMYPEYTVPIDGPGHIRMKEAEEVYKHVVCYTDIDINGHLNSMRYIEHLLNCFDLDYHKTHRLRRLDIAYSAECYAGDEIKIVRQEKTPNVWMLEVIRPDGKAAVKSLIEFE
ncbi:MAG: acyl-ACP thioesterase domain-containing protein [Bacteroidaceae bacterium]